MPEHIVSVCYREPSPAPLFLKGVPSSLSICAGLLRGSPGQGSRLLHTSVAQLLSLYSCVFSLLVFQENGAFTLSMPLI